MRHRAAPAASSAGVGAGVDQLLGDNQSVVGGTPFQPLAVQVTQDGLALAAHALYVSVGGPGASYVGCATTVLTGSGGVAAISCASTATSATTSAVVNVTDGVSQLTQPFLTFRHSVGDAPELLSPQQLRLPVNQTTPNAIRVKASTQVGSAAGVPVYFSPTKGITVSPVVSSDASGIVSTAVTLGCVSGAGRVDFGLAPGQVEGSVGRSRCPPSSTS